MKTPWCQVKAPKKEPSTTSRKGKKAKGTNTNVKLCHKFAEKSHEEGNCCIREQTKERMENFERVGRRSGEGGYNSAPAREDSVFL